MTNDFVKEATRLIAAAVGTDCGLKARLKFDLEGEGVILIDADKVPNRVGNRDGAADCTVTMSLDAFRAMMYGQIEPQTAFRRGKMRISGRVATAVELMQLLRAAGSAPPLSASGS